MKLSGAELTMLVIQKKRDLSVFNGREPMQLPDGSPWLQAIESGPPMSGSIAVIFNDRSRSFMTGVAHILPGYP